VTAYCLRGDEARVTVVDVPVPPGRSRPMRELVILAVAQRRDVRPEEVEYVDLMRRAEG
jgi:hypothetical protein